MSFSRLQHKKDLSYTLLRMLPFSECDFTLSIKPKRYTEHPKTLGEALLKRRIDLKLTKTAVAKIIGVPVGRIFDWENNRCKPDDGHIESVRKFIEGTHGRL